MLRRGILRVLPGRFVCRLVCTFAAYLVAIQAAGLPLLTLEEPASCCCAHKSDQQKCHCEVCTHARELGSNLPLMKTCGADTRHAAVTVGVEPFVLHDVRPEIAAAVAPRGRVRLHDPPLDPLREVPTPPPLVVA
jgi:hypothetical protein